MELLAVILGMCVLIKIVVFSVKCHGLNCFKMLWVQEHKIMEKDSERVATAVVKEQV